MSNLSVVVERDSVLVVDSRLIAQELGIQHKNPHHQSIRLKNEVMNTLFQSTVEG